MRDKRKGVNAAAMHFVKSSNPLDEVFIVNFNEEAFLDADFTDNVHLLEEALEKIDSRGGTALYDALEMSLKHTAERATLDKKVLIAITDGEDNASRISLEQIVQTLERSSVMVYTVALIGGESDRVTRRAKRALENISKATGANAYFPKNPNDVLGIATQIANEIRSQYVLAYTPPNLGSDTNFHKVEVRVEAPKKGKLNVRTRTGYYPQAILQTPPEETFLKEPSPSGL
jgi:VWFA-related protein